MLIRQRTRLDSVICVTDALHLQARLADSREAAEQLAQADIVLLNKTDLVDATGSGIGRGGHTRHQPDCGVAAQCPLRGAAGYAA